MPSLIPAATLAALTAATRAELRRIDSLPQPERRIAIAAALGDYEQAKAQAARQACYDRIDARIAKLAAKKARRDAMKNAKKNATINDPTTTAKNSTVESPSNLGRD
jgi:transcription elongation GreA/GreB family factor